MRLSSFVLPLVAFSLIFGTVAANASTITQTFSTGPIASTNAAVTFNPQQFNPTQGTLNFFIASFSGSYSENANSATPSAQLLSLVLGADTPAYYSSYQVGPATYTISPSSGNDTNITDLNILTGTGTVPLTFSVSSTGIPLTSSGFAVVLTYNYTPAAVAATPEPSSLALLTTGLFSAVGLIRRKEPRLR